MSKALHSTDLVSAVELQTGDWLSTLNPQKLRNGRALANMKLPASAPLDASARRTPAGSDRLTATRGMTSDGCLQSNDHAVDGS